MRNNYFLFLLFFTKIAFSQSDDKLITGKVIAEGIDISAINVVNLVNEKSVLTNEKGEFKIFAKTDDLLIFSSDRFEYKRKIVGREDYESGTIKVEMVAKPAQLEEVVIVKYKDIKLEDLRISSAKKHFTPAERKLYTAGDFKPIHLLQILGGSMPFDPILNAINGRTKRLKKEITIEKREFRLQEMEEMYHDDFYIQTLKIPKEDIMGFKYFLTEDEDFATVLLSKNKSLIQMYVIKSAENYVKLLADERE